MEWQQLIIDGYKRSTDTLDKALANLSRDDLNSMQFELLRFMGRHPKAKLSFYVITRAFRIAVIDLGNALMALVERDILMHRLDDNGLVTYSLSADEKIRAYIHELAALNWSEAMALKRLLV